jgi:hypothetical protein
MKRLIRCLLASAIMACIAVSANDAGAIIGRPLTPLSFAGVARRTTRRAVYAGAYSGYGYRYGYGYGYSYGYGYPGYAAPAYAAGSVTTLPTGCVSTVVGDVAVQQCGSVYYRPYYEGTTVVYRTWVP